MGPVCDDVKKNARWIPTASFDAWSADVSLSLFRLNKKMYPFVEFKARAIFDPQVDYLYVGQEEFTKWIVPVLNTMYGDDIGCTKTECYFVRSCDKVKGTYEHAALRFALGTINNPEE